MINFSKLMKFSVIVLLVLGWTANAHAQRVSQNTVVLNGQSARSGEGGFLDLKTGTVYNLEQATLNQENIDFMYAHSKNSGANLIAPRSTRLKGFGTYRRGVQESWHTKNATRMISIGNDKNARKIFRRVKNNEQLEKAYKSELERLKGLPDYKKATYGPQISRRRLEEGDYVMFQCRGKGRRNVYAIAQVKKIEPGYRGSITLDIKSTGQ